MLHTKYQGPRPSGFRGDVVWSNCWRHTTHDGRRTLADGNSSPWAFGSGELITILKQQLSSDSVARLERCLFKVKKSLWQSLMKIESKLCLLESTHGFSKNWPNGLVFNLTWPIFNSGQDFIRTNILTKFHEDWIKILPSRVYSWFYLDLT